MAVVVRVAFMIAVLFGASGTAWALSAAGLAESEIQIVAAESGSQTFQIELAQRSDEMERGLMYRKYLAARSGMLFDFGPPRRVSMWMKNTLIPLDMLFIDKDGLIIAIAERTIPQSLTVISSPSPVRAVLELNGGSAEHFGIKVGDRAVHPLFDPKN